MPAFLGRRRVRLIIPPVHFPPREPWTPAAVQRLATDRRGVRLRTSAEASRMSWASDSRIRSPPSYRSYPNGLGPPDQMPAAACSALSAIMRSVRWSTS